MLEFQEQQQQRPENTMLRRQMNKKRLSSRIKHEKCAKKKPITVNQASAASQGGTEGETLPQLWPSLVGLLCAVWEEIHWMSHTS